MTREANQLNAAFYCFAPMENLSSLREEWRPRLESLGVKGTIILAPEGVNGFLAGTASALRDALGLIRSLPALAGLQAKESRSSEVPFAKLCIKLKKEIVTFRVPVAATNAARIAPGELASWYREGRDFVALDTRNEYEYRLGTFQGAHNPRIGHFVDFAEAAKALPEEWKKKPVVTFCTGGIRCEKAAPFLQTLGFEQVYQLEGGILNYFEKAGREHWQGECFVFDQRIALDPRLEPTGARLCTRCQGPVPAREAACIHCGRETH
jgi:UPF0176 protein